MPVTPAMWWPKMLGRAERLWGEFTCYCTFMIGRLAERTRLKQMSSLILREVRDDICLLGFPYDITILDIMIGTCVS